MLVYQNNPLNEFAQPVVSFGLDSASLLNCNKAWFCFRTLHWISYKCKLKKKPRNKSRTFPLGFIIDFSMPLSYLNKFSLVCNANVETTVCTSSKPHQSRANMWSQCVRAGITKSVCIVLVSVLHWSAMHAKPLVRLCKVQRLPEIMDLNRTTQMWHEQSHTLASPPLRESLCSVTVFHVQL